MTDRNQLSEKSVVVLTLIAEGQSYGQIVDSHPAISYFDIFAAAEEALRLSESPGDYQVRLEKIKKRYPKAYELWTEDDDARLTTMYCGQTPLAEIATKLERQPSAIRARLAKLDLTSGIKPLG